MKGKKPIATRIRINKKGEKILNIYTTSGVYHIKLEEGYGKE